MRNFNATFSVILTPLKMPCITKALIRYLRHNKRNVITTKMKRDCEVAYARNADVAQKSLS